MRELLERKMTGLLLGLKNGTKSTTDVLPTLNSLKKNCGSIAEDYERKYIAIMSTRKLAA